MESMESVKVVLDSGAGKLEKFFWDNKDAIVENMYMSATPFLMLLFARRSHKAYIKFEIFATIMHALVAIFCPKTIYRHLVSFQKNLKSNYRNIYWKIKKICFIKDECTIWFVPLQSVHYYFICCRCQCPLPNVSDELKGWKCTDRIFTFKNDCKKFSKHYPLK